MFTGASLVGFVFSAITMHVGVDAGLRPWLARLLGMLVAMNLAFLLNGRFTFNALSRQRFLPLWGAYMANSSFGNLCNYFTFLTLRSLHRPVISNLDVAFLAGAVMAWAINFLGARYLVFGALGRRLAARAKDLMFSRPSRPPAPAPAEHGSSRR